MKLCDSLSRARNEPDWTVSSSKGIHVGGGNGNEVRSVGPVVTKDRSELRMDSRESHTKTNDGLGRGGVAEQGGRAEWPR